MFVSQEWTVLTAQTIPCLPDDIKIESSEKDEEDGGKERDLTNTNDKQRDRDSKQLLSLQVDSPQPSDVWPSDHFMLLTTLSLE
jgi:hypothetical protein